jgi:hypothetical protein
MRRLLWLLLLAACTGPSLSWRDRPRPEDPAPSGPPDLQRYKESHYQALGRRFAASLGHDELLRELATARVLYLGDHHADRALHARHERLLDALAATGRPFVLGLEALGFADEPALRRYLAGDATLDQLRRAVASRWPDSWLEDVSNVDAPFYRRLLARARTGAVPVFALEPVPRAPLRDRDAIIAARIRNAADQHADALVVVVLGHAHLLGDGNVVGRVGLPHVVFGARLSATLAERYAGESRPRVGFLRTDTGVVFFDPP